MFGIWVIASPIVAYIIRKPGAAFIAEVTAAAVELLTGSHFGLAALLVGAISRDWFRNCFCHIQI